LQSSKQLTAASAELLELLEEEKRKKAQVVMSGPPRHSFFTGTFTRRWKVSGRLQDVFLYFCRFASLKFGLC
jgi:hypothetical protein